MSYANLKPDVLEEEMSLNSNAFEKDKEPCYCDVCSHDIPIFVSFEDVPIFDEFPNEELGNDLEGDSILAFGEDLPY